MTGIRLATFNVENLDDRPNLDPPLSARLPILRPQLQRLDADILCLQEVNGQRRSSGARTLAALDTLIADTPYATFHRAVTHNDAGHIADVHNLVTLSRWPIGAAEVIRCGTVARTTWKSGDDAGQGHEVAYGRPGLATRVDVAGRVLWVVNLHLKSPAAAVVRGGKEDAHTWRSTAAWAEGCYLAALQRNAQALDARLWVDGVFDNDAAALIAVCGDLNADLDDVPVRLLRAAEDDTGNGALAGRALVAPERQLPQDRRFSVMHHGRAEMLDHVLVSRALLGGFKALEVHNETLADELVGFAAVRHDTASYHAPLVASFEI